jgi:adenylosuccinate synthase
LGLVTPDQTLERWLRETENVVFEGAQGVLLDADAGFHPFTTWSRCTTANAFELIEQAAPQGARVFKIGVMRSYVVRHGPGPLPTETNELMPPVSEHNQTNQWQGAVRYGWFDAVLARYALEVTGGVDALMVTHLDALSNLQEWKYCAGYRSHPAFDQGFIDHRAFDGVLTKFRIPSFLSLLERERFTQALCAATPLLETCEPEAGKVVQKLEALIGQPVDLVSRGPIATDVEVLNVLPL